MTRRERPLYFQRLVLVLLQMAIAAGLGAGAYLTLRGREEAAFKTAFSDAASHILRATGEKLGDRLEAAATLALYVEDSAAFNSAYPNVTLPTFTQVATLCLVASARSPD
jgi:hypothetical protein